MNDPKTSRLCSRLNLVDSKLTTEQRALLGLVRSTLELGRNFRDSSHTLAVVNRWLLLLDPSATDELARRMLDDVETTFQPVWLADLYKDAAVRGSVPPLLVVAALIGTSPPDRGDAHAGAEYVDAAASTLDIHGPLLNDLTGWLRGTASPQKSVEVESILSAIGQTSVVAQRIVESLKGLSSSFALFRVECGGASSPCLARRLRRHLTRRNKHPAYISPHLPSG